MNTLVPTSTFTYHGLQRSLERTSLSIDSILDIINQDLCILLGSEENKHHKLFFSTLDNHCFIAVQDSFNKEIVTLLPCEYSKWNISNDSLERARGLVCGECKIEEPTMIEELKVIKKRVLRCIVYVRDPNTYEVSCKHIGKIGEYDKLEDFGNDKDAVSILKEIIKSYGFSLSDVENVYVKMKDDVLKVSHLLYNT